MNAFIGRAPLLARLDQGRLLTLLGTGGIGKTRLAREWLRTRSGVFCDLTSASTADEMTSALMAAFDMGSAVAIPMMLEGKTIVLDNLEQVIGPARTMVRQWLSQTNRARFIVTTREALGLPEEEELRLAPLSEEDAVSLFAERAGERRAAFRGDMATLRALVRRLDCLPLAIELAVARTDMMSPKQLLDRLDKQLHLRDDSIKSRRHRSLETTLEWSWSLLSHQERDALTRCSVFSGGFSLDAAEAVLGASAADLLQSLRSKSLVMIGGDAEPRFCLLETVRQFSAGRLGARTEAEAACDAHFITLGRALLDDAGRAKSAAAEATLQQEFDNFIACQKRHPTSAELTLAISVVLMQRGPHLWQRALLSPLMTHAKGDTRLAVSLARVESLRMSAEYADGFAAIAEAKRKTKGVWRGRFLLIEGRLKRDLGHFVEARDLIAGSLPLLAHDSLSTAMALSDLGQLERSPEHYYRALALLERLGEIRQLTTALIGLGTVFYEQGQCQEGLAQLRRAVTLQESTNDRRLKSIAYTHLGIALFLAAEDEDCRAALDKALVLQRDTHNRRYEMVTLCYMGMLAFQRRKHGEADRLLTEAVDIAEALKSPWHISYALAHLARPRAFTQSPDASRALLKRALSIGETLAYGDYGTFLRSCSGYADFIEGKPVTVDNAEAGSAELQVLRRDLRRLTQQRPPSTVTSATTAFRLEVAHDCSWFRVDDGKRQSLKTRKVLRSFLATLVSHHGSSGRRVVTQAAMLRAVWPGETLRPSAARDRLYNAVATLRRHGLKELLLTQTDGYLLDPRVEIVELQGQ